MSDNKIILAMSSETPQGLPGDQALCDALRAHDIEPLLRNWDDPGVDWSEGRFTVLRTAANYAQRRDHFLAWARSVPKLLNSPDVIAWNTDKHYLLEFERLGLPIIPTIWLEPSHGLSKHQVHTRFPAFGDFVVKPTISSAGRDVGLYTSTEAYSRMEAIDHAMDLLQAGSGVMVQRYLQEVDSQEEWGWGEQVRRVIHKYMKDHSAHDSQILYDRIDLVPDGQGSFYVMEVSLVEGNLYLDVTSDAVENFADAIAQRFYW